MPSKSKSNLVDDLASEWIRNPYEPGSLDVPSARTLAAEKLLRELNVDVRGRDVVIAEAVGNAIEAQSKAVPGDLSCPIKIAFGVCHWLLADVNDAKKTMARAGANDNFRETSNLASSGVSGPEIARKIIPVDLGVPHDLLGEHVERVYSCESFMKGIRGESDKMRSVKRAVWATCFGESVIEGFFLQGVLRDQNVLVLGESGTGKELIAKAIRRGTPPLGAGPKSPHGNKADKGREKFSWTDFRPDEYGILRCPGWRPMGEPAINISAMPKELIPGELFGYAKGSHSTATEDYPGHILTASGGVLFIDEVGELEAGVQVQLLRTIEENAIQPSGVTFPVGVDVRYVSATSSFKEIEEGRGLRPDLYHRLRGSVIKIPPLRERPDDIMSIGLGYLEQLGRDALRFSPQGAYIIGDKEASIVKWLGDMRDRSEISGNVREIQNGIRDIVLGVSGRSQAVDDIHRENGVVDQPAVTSEIPDELATFGLSMQAVKKWHFGGVYETQGRNISKTARVLGVNRSTVNRVLGKKRRPRK